MKWFKEYLKQNPIHTPLFKKTGAFSALSITQEAALILSANSAENRPLIWVKQNSYQAQLLYERLMNLDPTLKVALLDQEESLRLEMIAGSLDKHLLKMETLGRILENDVEVLIVSAHSLLRKLPPLDYLKSLIVDIKVGDQLDIGALRTQLTKLGYQQVTLVEAPMTFAGRGEVLDIYPVLSDYPIRIDFFDDEVESLRGFNPNTQRSFSDLKQVSITPCSDLLLSEASVKALETKVHQKLQTLKLKDSHQEYQQIEDIILDQLTQMKTGLFESAHYPLISLDDQRVQLMEYFQNPLIVYSPIEAMNTHLKMYVEDTMDYLFQRHEMAVGLDIYDVLWSFDRLPKGHSIHEFESLESTTVSIHDAFDPHLEGVELIRYIDRLAQNKTVILALADSELEKIINQLVASKVPYQMFIRQDELTTGLWVYPYRLDEGFQIGTSIVVLSRKEVLQKQVPLGRYGRLFSLSEPLTGIAQLEDGDYVVHKNYGVGIYEGLETKIVDRVEKDYIKIVYQNEDLLMVPLEQFSLIRKYAGREGVAIKLNKLGTQAWNKTKDRIKESVNDIADRLIALYQSREKQKGFKFSPDNQEVVAFESEFAYELTPDQKQAVKEIKAEMETEHPMDRLLIGDVGFGKTEVAIRAAFKALVDHKQVVFLCPTTVLSAQHYRTFVDRFKNYPVNIGLLNRFVEPSQQKQTIKAMKEGRIDILIGTHRVLSKDVRFKDLGLLVIDEEQRFGVEQKERIKEIKQNVDVLSLSATPIPRTLQMSLIGIRSLSQLNTPPQNRLPVITHVVEKNLKLIKDIISKEVARNGQVFYLFNNISEIYQVATWIQQSFPNVVVRVAHGQMDRDEIEETMLEFTDNKIQVLVCTTIVETGIDIPNANTMIIDRADRFGLAQLYQIKGRVGRGDRLAYAYLLIDRQKQLSEIATKRLQAIKEFTQLGSGYKIAMRDLTIRGAGEILGGNQSGFIDSVGIDLYLELLQEVLEGKKQQEPQRPISPLGQVGHIPDHYVQSDALKIDLYQRIEKINSLSTLKLFVDDTLDRYGEIPNATSLLIEKKRLELLLADHRIESYKETVRKTTLVFTEEFSQNIDGVKLFEIINEISVEIQLKYTQNKIRLEFENTPERLQEILKVLAEMNTFTRSEHEN